MVNNKRVNVQYERGNWAVLAQMVNNKRVNVQYERGNWAFLARVD